MVLIRDADALLEAAQNALLKSLEEPPPATVFVLTSAAPDALLRTVRSRTMRLTFGRLTIDGGRDSCSCATTTCAAAEARRLAGAAPTAAPGAALALGSSDLTDDARRRACSCSARPAPRDLGARLAVAKEVVGEKKPERTRQELAAVLRAGVVARPRPVASCTPAPTAALLANGDVADALERLARRCRRRPRARPSRPSTAASTALERNAGTKLVAEWVAVGALTINAIRDRALIGLYPEVMKPRIAITGGDPAGIGPEIAAQGRRRSARARGLRAGHLRGAAGVGGADRAR